jgi:hypothetical protein
MCVFRGSEEDCSEGWKYSTRYVLSEVRYTSCSRAVDESCSAGRGTFCSLSTGKKQRQRRARTFETQIQISMTHGARCHRVTPPNPARATTLKASTRARKEFSFHQSATVTATTTATAGAASQA